MPRRSGRSGLWVLVGAALAAEVAVVVLALRVFVSWPDGVAGPLLVGGGAVAAGLVLSSLAGSRPGPAAAKRPVLRVVLLALGMSVLVAGVGFVVVVGATGLPEPAERSVAGWWLVAAGGVGMLAPGAARWLDEWLDGRLEAGGVRPDEQLRAFGARLTRAVPMDELLLQMAETVKRGLANRRAEVWLRDDAALVLSVGVPHRRAVPVVLDVRSRAVVATAGVSGAAWARVWLPDLVDVGDDGDEGTDATADRVRFVPLAHRGELLGLLVAERHDHEPPFGDDDERVLGDLARQVGVALHNVELDAALEHTVEQLRRRNAELQDSRARIVSAGDAERRRLERNLHDGAQQHLTGLSVKLQLAAALAADDAEAWQAVLAEMRADLDEAKEQLRSLAHGLFPPLLSIGGLRDALPAVVARAPVAATVEVAGVGRYGSEVEAAVYFCCVEAIQNAAKHAGDTAHARVRVWEDGDALRFVVADDGQGFDGHDGLSNGSGHGLVNMSDRVGAIGGELTIRSAPGEGTTVEGRVPSGTRGRP